jgi:hypothetical protein
MGQEPIYKCDYMHGQQMHVQGDLELAQKSYLSSINFISFHCYFLFESN